nr:AMP-binding protein [Corynebacterium striatum]
MIDATTQWTYEQLNEQSDKWAQLIAATDPAPGDLVGIMMEKSAQQIAAVLGAMKAGCAYLPLSVDQPVGRNTSIINDAGASIVAMDHPDVDFAALAEHCTVITLADVARHRPGDQALSESSPTPSSLAYVIYTSGTTGTPKGVAITHESAVNTIVDVNERLGVTPTDRILGISELNFDLSVYDIFGMFARGATLVLPSPADKRDPQCWADAVTTHSVTLWNSVPALFFDVRGTPPRTEPHWFLRTVGTTQRRLDTCKYRLPGQHPLPGLHSFRCWGCYRGIDMVKLVRGRRR